MARFLRGLRLLVIDGFELDLPDTPANAAEFGYAGSGANRSAFCKARVVALAECGTHAFLAAEVDGYQSSLGIDRTADSNHAWPPPGDWKACSATGPRGKSAILGHRVGYAALLQRSMDGPGPGGMPGNRSVHFLDRWAAEQT